MNIDFNSLSLYILGFIGVIVLMRIFAKPIKIILKIALNTVLGGVLLLVLNSFGGIYGINIGINPLTSFICGVLGIPGLALLYVLRLIFGI